MNTIPFIINRSGDYQDELGWSAIWLYQATGESKYLVDAEANRASGSAWGDSWDDKTASTNVCKIMQVANLRCLIWQSKIEGKDKESHTSCINM